MTDGYVIQPEALEKDALKFDGWSQDLDGIQKALPIALSSMDFSVIPGAQDVYVAYQRAVLALHAYVGEGSDEFDGFARALLRSALVYMTAEGYSAEDVARLELELESL